MKKRLLHRLQKLGEQATRVQQVVDRAPGQVAKLRETVSVTTDQLRQLRSEMQGSLGALRAVGDDPLLQALREVDGGRPTLQEAGFELTGVDMELSSAPRLLVHLDRVAEVPVARLRGLVDANAARRTLHAILAALLRGTELADKVDLIHLGYQGVTVAVGPLPYARVCWRLTEVDEEETEGAVFTELPSEAIEQIESTASSGSLFASGGFFGKGPAEGLPGTVAPSVAPGESTPTVSTPPPPPSPMSPAPEPPTTGPVPPRTPALTLTPPPTPSSFPSTTGDWRRGALDRFKRMPDLGKRGGSPG